MINLKAKWKALLLTVSCFFVCLGIGVATVDKPLSTGVTATAETTYTEYTVNALTVHSHSTFGNSLANNTTLWLNGTGDVSDAWADYTCVSGSGVKLNGEAAEIRVQDFNGGLYLSFAAVNTGDVISIGGTFTCEDQAIKYIISNRSFIWTGSGWFGCAETYTDAQLAEYDTVTIHRLGLGTEKVINGDVFEGEGLSYKTNTPDENNSSAGVKFRFGYNSVDTSAGEIALRLRGGAWEGFHFRISEGYIRDINGDWLSVPLANNVNYNIELGAIDTKDGANVWVYIKINGVLCTTKTVAKASYSAFTTKSISIHANPGTKATLSVAYETQNIGELDLHGNSRPTGGAGAANNVLYLQRKGDKALPVENWDYLFTADSASNFKVNGENATLAEMKSTPAGLYLAFNGVNAGDVVSISGNFTGVDYGAKYVIEESLFKWTGSNWEKDYPTHELGTLKMSSVYAATNMAHFVSADDRAFVNASSDGDLLWNSPFAFVEGSGTGVTLNGVAGHTVKFPGNMFVELNKTPEVNDILIIDGTFINETLGVKYHVSKSAFQWDGSVWKTYEPPQYTVNELIVHLHSTAGNVNANNTTLWLYGTGDDRDAWAYYTCISGEGIKINGNTAAVQMQDFGGGLYLKNFSVQTNDVLSIGGTFVSEKDGTTYVIADAQFTWNGSGWVSYVAPVPMKDYKATAISPAKESNASTLYIYASGTGDDTFPNGNEDWDSKYVFEASSGDGMTLGGKAFSTDDIKLPGTDLYINLGKAANKGDVFTIDGAFVNEAKGIRIVFEDCALQWNGSAWVGYIPDESYDQRNLGKMDLVANLSSTAGANATNSFVYLTWNLEKYGSMPTGWDVWNNLFELGGAHVYVNDGNENKIAKAVVSNEWLFIEFAGVNKGDKITIGGTLVYNSNPFKLVLDDVSFVWNGSVWAPYVEYTTHNVSALSIHAYSMAGSEYANNTTLWLNGTGLDSNSWLEYTLVSGTGVTLNGNPATVKVQDFTNGLYLAFGAVNKGAVLTISGTYACAGTAIKYNISEMSFQWTGAGWINYFEDSQLATYDVVNIIDIGWGVEKTVNATGAIDNTGLSYTPSAANTTGSVKLRFGFNSTNTASGATEIRLRGTAWQGIRFIIETGQLKSNYSNTTTAYALSSNTDYEIELGAIDLNNGTAIWIYAKVNGVIVISDVVLKTAENPKEPSGDETPVYPTFATFNTNHVSFYFNAGVNATFTDLVHVAITYITEATTLIDYAEKNTTYTIAATAKSYKTFVGWVANGALYHAGATVTVENQNVTFTALEIDFHLEDGAAIRIAGTAETSGIRFTTLLKEADLNALLGYGATVSFGTLIMPYDYLGAGQAPNLEKFSIENKQIVKIPSTIESGTERWEVKEGYLLYRGAMQNLKDGNYDRLFAGRGYMEITFENGETMTVYTPFDKKDNVRSIRYVAQAFQADTSTPGEGEIRYAQLSGMRKEVVDAYAAIDEIKLMNYAAYAANNFFNVIAWNYPALDESNGYNNDANIAIATQMKAAGIKVVNLTGKNLLVITDQASIEKTRQIINFFWSQGLQTSAFAGNTRGMEEDKEGNLVFGNMPADFTQLDMPDFSDCAGFIGFMFWDEPTEEDTVMTKLADLAIKFNNVYAGTNVTFMNNLLPSYASRFSQTSAYIAYVEEYCEKVLSKVKGEKWLSVDSYPVKADYSLDKAFLLDLGVLKTNAMEVGAHAHVALQSSGFENSQSSAKKRIPTEAEMRMQAYAAMAFGIDSISWFSYSPSGSDSETFYTFVDNAGTITDTTAYNAFTKVNTELAKIGAVYSAFTWKGIILGRGTYSTSNKDYSAFTNVMGKIGAYELKATDTKHLSSIEKSQRYYNYLMGVMQDGCGNEGYVLCNYNALGSASGNKSQTITLTFKTDVSKVVIYRGGEMSEVDTTTSGANRTLAISLATGEGVIVLPSKIG